jgi:hypothetical protein
MGVMEGMALGMGMGLWRVECGGAVMWGDG